MSAATLMAYGMPAGPANLIVAQPARIAGAGDAAAEKRAITRELMALGLHAKLAHEVANNGTEAAFRAFGMDARLAAAVKAIVNA